MYVLRSILHILRVHKWYNLDLNSLSNKVAAGAESNKASPRRERVCASVWVCVCVWLYEREGERERERERGWQQRTGINFLPQNWKRTFSTKKYRIKILFFWKLQQRPSLSPTTQQNDSRKKRPVTDFILDTKYHLVKKLANSPEKPRLWAFHLCEPWDSFVSSALNVLLSFDVTGR